MKGGLRWPLGPFQVVCVLVAVLLTAAFSLQCGSTSRTGTSTDKTDQCDFDNLGAHPDAGAIAVLPGFLNSIDVKIARTIPAVHNDGDNFFMQDTTKRRSTAALAIAASAPAWPLNLSSDLTT
jgi:hypothetical protein